MTHSPLTLDLTIDPVKIQENQFCAEIIDALKAIRPQWCAAENYLTSLKAKVFTGGISNQLYGYYQVDKFEEDVVLFRVYGQGSELMIDRKVETENIQVLHAAGLCPPLYAIYNNGISYGFANGVTLDENLVRDDKVKRLIAMEILHLQKVTPPGREVVTGLWDKMYKFLELGPDGFEDAKRQKEYTERIRPKDVLKKELDELKSHLEVIDSPVVFCHNDLLLKNVIYNKDKGCVHFIDHEYAMYNYEHFEIGNHFCEYAGVDEVDFRRYPDREYQLDWLRYYLEEQAFQNGGQRSDVTDRDVEVCYVKTNKFALAAHMFWGLWGLIQAKHSIIDFGFLEYAQLKLDEYFAKKDAFLALKLPA